MKTPDIPFETADVASYVMDRAAPHIDELQNQLMTDDLTDVQRIAILKLIRIRIDMMIDTMFERLTDPNAVKAANLIIGA